MCSMGPAEHFRGSKGSYYPISNPSRTAGHSSFGLPTSFPPFRPDAASLQPGSHCVLQVLQHSAADLEQSGYSSTMQLFFIYLVSS